MASRQAAAEGRGGKRKRVVLTLREKMDVCSRLERGESRKALMQEYNVGMSTLYDIKAHKAQLLRFVANSDSSQALEHRRTLHTPKLEHLDRVLYQWFLARRAEGVPVSGPMLIEKAKDLYGQMRLSEPCVFSGGWLWRFKARHGIKKLDASGEKQVADRRAAEQFCGFFRSLAAEHGLSPEQVYSADETGLFWRGLPSPGPEAKQARDRLSVLVCANATGSHRIKPLAIGRCGGARARRGVQQLPLAYRAHSSAWVDWFHHIFAPAVREHFRASGLPADSKAVLLLDSSRAPPQEPQLVSDNIFTVFLPPGAAALLQPMELGIRRDFLERCLRAPARPGPGAGDAMGHVVCAWNAVPGQVFRRAWRKLWPAVAFAEGSSEEEEEEEEAEPEGEVEAEAEPEREGADRHFCAAKPHKTLAHILELVRAGPACPDGPLQGREAQEWGTAEREAVEARVPAGAENAERVGDDEAAWERAALAFAALLGFAEGQPCFTAQELGQLCALHSAFRRQRQLRRCPGAPRAAVKVEALQERPGARSPSPAAQED